MAITSRRLAKRIGLAAAGVVAAGMVVLGGSVMASAATPTPSASSSTPSSTSSTSSTSSAPAGAGKGASNDTAVTGDELTKVTAAITAKDSTVTVTGVQKDPDGSYDVAGTKAGAAVTYDVSADLKTFTLRAGRGGGGHGGGSNDAAVTGDELTKVTAAMTAKDSTVTVTEVRKDPDGSYDVLGTKAGANVMYDVSADLNTFTLNAGHAGK